MRITVHLKQVTIFLESVFIFFNIIFFLSKVVTVTTGTLSGISVQHQELKYSRSLVYTGNARANRKKQHRYKNITSKTILAAQWVCQTLLKPHVFRNSLKKQNLKM